MRLSPGDAREKGNLGGFLKQEKEWKHKWIKHWPLPSLSSKPGRNSRRAKVLLLNQAVLELFTSD